MVVVVVVGERIVMMRLMCFFSKEVEDKPGLTEQFTMQAVRCCGDNGDDQVDGSICHVGNDEDDCDILAPNDFIICLFPKVYKRCSRHVLRPAAL